jgi:hypothetical protein
MSMIGPTWEGTLLGGSSPNQLFVSKSGSFADARKWVNRLKRRFNSRFSVVSDDDFRALQDPFTLHESWLEQFWFTRESLAMIVLLDPEILSSEGQDTEILDVQGRNMPIAYCRAEMLAESDANRRFEYFLVHGAPDRHRCPAAYFDFAGRPADQELDRLAGWLDVCAKPPLKLPHLFNSGRPCPFEVTVHVRQGQMAVPMVWSGLESKLVFNYGRLLVFDEQRARSNWQWPESGQVIVPLVTTKEPGGVRGEIVLPKPGFGHALLTVGEPETDYTYECGGLRSPEVDWLLWWDFFVDID